MTIPPQLPARAPKMREQVRLAKAALVELEAATPMLALAKAEMNVGAHKAFADHEVAVSAARAHLDAKIAAAEAAVDLDRQAAAARVEQLCALDPGVLMEGIGERDCCNACSEFECVIGPGVGRCVHPNKGGLPPTYFNDEPLRRLQASARSALAADIAAGDEDDDEDEEFEDDEEEAA